MLSFELENILKTPENQTGILVLPMTGVLTRDLDGFTSGQLSKAIVVAGLKDKVGNFLSVVAPSGTKWHAVLIYGTGQDEKTKDKNKKSPEQLAMELGGQVFAHATAVASKMLGDDKKRKLPLFWVVDKGTQSLDNMASMILGFRLKQWQFHHYLTDEKKLSHYPFAMEKMIYEGGLGDKAAVATVSQEKTAIHDGVIFTRQLVSEPANVLTPPEFARRASLLAKDGVKISVLGEKEMEKLQMHSLLAVGQGSSQESQLVLMEWHGGEKNAAPICFVGKGVCFDTGGISLKPSGGMEEMIWDMGGAGTVSGLMKLLAQRKAPVNAVGVLAIVENMPDGAAQRPGDIVKSMSGQTIEVLNTDAEGRMILADALWYAQENFKPTTIIDLATLTGAMIVPWGMTAQGFSVTTTPWRGNCLTRGRRLMKNYGKCHCRRLAVITTS